MYNGSWSSPVLKGVYARLGAAKSNDSTDNKRYDGIELQSPRKSFVICGVKK